MPYKTIGIGSAGAKILCGSHNNGLSDADQEGAQFSRAVRQVWPMVAGGTVMSKPLEYHFDGKRLERYFLKSAIGAFVKARSFRWRGGSAYDDPPCYLVEAAFARAPLAPPMGLYAIEYVEKRPAWLKVFHLMLGTNEKQEIRAARIEAHMLLYVVWLDPDRPPNLKDDEFLILADTSNVTKREMMKVDRDKVRVTYRQPGNVLAGPGMQALFHIKW
jgi:hypothetical protein